MGKSKKRFRAHEIEDDEEDEIPAPPRKVSSDHSRRASPYRLGQVVDDATVIMACFCEEDGQFVLALDARGYFRRISF